MSTIKTFGTVDERSLDQLKRCMEAGDAEFGVLCADHHPGYSQPIGGGIVYEGYVSPSGVSYDIGCGNKAARTELTRDDLDARGGVEAIMHEITRRISFGMGVPAAERTDHEVLEILGAEAVHEVHNHHNFAWREEHLGRTYWVIRKGCTPARPGQEGFVGGSMGDESVILEGVESTENEQALYSTVHGAGRVMSRSQAAGRIRRRKRYACRHRDCDRVFDVDGISSAAGAPKKGVCPDHPESGLMKVWVQGQVKPGLVDWPAVQARLREQGIVLVGGGADEAPEV